MAVITNTTFGMIKDEIQRRNAILQEIAEAFDVSTWKQIRFDVKSGQASKYAVGSELLTKYTYNNVKYDFPWIVVDNDRECTWEDGSTHPGLWLCAKYVTPHYCDFDAAEGTAATEEMAQEGMYYVGVTGTTYTALDLSTGDTIPYGDHGSILKGTVRQRNVYKDGYNRYKDSALRQWLNSDAAEGEWWSAAHNGDNPPVQLSSQAGFMSYIDADFVAVINPVKVQTAANTSIDAGVTDITYDKFFPLSVEEFYGSPQIATVEGPFFPYWKTATGLSSPSNSANAGRILYKANSTSSTGSPFMRSASKNTAYNSWVLSSTGELSNSTTVRNNRNVIPCCVIS